MLLFGLDVSLPETFTLSTTRRLPANDWAIRFASSRSLAEGAVPFSSIVSSVTFTEMLLLVSVGSLWKAVWMSLFTWSEEELAAEELAVLPVVELVPACAPTEPVLPASPAAEGVEDADDEGEVEEVVDCDEAEEEGEVEDCALLTLLFGDAEELEASGVVALD